jgi:hypothetical protein
VCEAVPKKRLVAKPPATIGLPRRELESQWETEGVRIAPDVAALVGMDPPGDLDWIMLPAARIDDAGHCSMTGRRRISAWKKSTRSSAAATTPSLSRMNMSRRRRTRVPLHAECGMSFSSMIDEHTGSGRHSAERGLCGRTNDQARGGRSGAIGEY